MLLTFRKIFQNFSIEQKKPVILKAFQVWNDKNIFSMSPIKATYIEKNNQLQIQKPGWILMEIVPIKKEETNIILEWENKKQFSLSIKQMGILLQHKYQQFDTDSKFQAVVTYLTQHKQKKQLKIIKKADLIILSIDDDVNKENNSYQINLTIGEYITILELITFSLPYLLGWDTLQTPYLEQQQI